MKPLLFIPCYKHTDHINNLLHEIRKYYKNDILIIDDGSNQGSFLDSSFKNVVLLINDRNRGKGYSIVKASKYMITNEYTHLLVIDSDKQHDPSKISKFLKVDKNVDFVYGRRAFSKPMPLSRIFSNSITSLIISILCSNRIYDSQCGYRRYSVNMFKGEIFKEYGYQFETEILLKKINKSSIIQFVNIPTIYNENRSSMNYISDTFKFIRCIINNII